MVIIFALISLGGWVYETIYCSVEERYQALVFLLPGYGIGAIVWY